MVYQNVRGLRTKISEFFCSVASEDYDIVYLTETWLCSELDSSDLFDDRYIVFRCDRNALTSSCKRGGGVLIAIKNGFSAVQIKSDDLELECIFISVNLMYRKKLLLCVIYFPPNSHFDAYVKFFNYFARFSSYDNIFVCGDFNLCITDDFNSCKYLDSKVKELHNFMQLHNLNQFNTVPNSNMKYLDLVLSNIHSCDISVGCCDRPLVPEDGHHPALSIVLNFMLDRNDKQKKIICKYNFKKANFLNIWYMLSDFDWNFLNAFNDVNSATYAFYENLNMVFDQTIPFKTSTRNRFPFWYSGETIQLIRKKSRVRKRALNSGYQCTYEEFRYLRTALKHSIAKDHTIYLQNTENSLISNPKKFWSYFNEKNPYQTIFSTIIHSTRVIVILPMFLLTISALCINPAQFMTEILLSWVGATMIW